MASNGSFKQLGNLAFYDGWSPNYVYFSSLLAMANSDNLNKKAWGGIDRQAASKIAAEAIGHAQQYSHLNGMNPEEANDTMQLKMQQIINFLSSAITYEENNEKTYFQKKFIELSKTFTPNEIAAIQPLQELMEGLKDQNSTDYYKNYISLINVLLNGLENTKTIAKRETERIEEIDKAVEGIIDRHTQQIKGLYTSRYQGRTNKNGQAYKLESMIQRAEENLRKNVKIQYLTHSNLTSGTYSERTIHHKDGTKELEKKTHFLLGSKGAFAKINKSIDTELAHWATDTIKKVAASSTFIRKMAKQIQGKYPPDADFSLLIPELKQQIILTIQQYGLKDLKRMLAKKYTKKACKEVIKDLVDPEKDDNTIFNMVASYNIQGLYLNYGQVGKTSKLFKDAESIDDLYGPKAEGLYDALSYLIKICKSKNIKLTEEQSYLKQVFEQDDSWQAAEEMNDIIRNIEKLQTHLAELNRRKKENDLELNELMEDTFTLGQDSSGQDIILSFAIDGDKVIIDQSSGSLGSSIRKLEGAEYFDFQKLTSSVQNMASVLKRRASKQLQERLANNMYNILNSDDFEFDEEYLMNQVKQGLENMHISVTGPKVSELASAIQFQQRGDNLIVDWQGGINGKNDVVVITVDDVISNIKINGPTNRLEEVLVDNINPELEFARKEFLTEWNKQLKQTIATANRKNYAKKYTHVARAFLKNAAQRDSWDEKLTEKYKELQAAWGNQKKILIKAGIKEEKLEKIKKQFLNTLASSFYVSTTVKSYDTYLNNMGFTGGSLGSSLNSQLTRLANLFSLSGLSIDADFKWLKSAIINCSPLTIAGESNKELIENYLGSIAAFALFDEGGAEGKLITNYMKDMERFKNSQVNPNILHLYRVNGIYVPGSYVLRQVYNALTGTVMPLIDSIDNTMRAGATVEIINGVSENMIPNRPIAHTSHPKTSAWKIVGRQAEKSSSIQILFLAGLFDIANSINNTLNNLPIPT